jgi:hypothetical protein
MFKRLSSAILGNTNNGVITSCGTTSNTSTLSSSIYDDNHSNSPSIASHCKYYLEKNLLIYKLFFSYHSNESIT